MACFFPRDSTIRIISTSNTDTSGIVSTDTWSLVSGDTDAIQKNSTELANIIPELKNYVRNVYLFKTAHQYNILKQTNSFTNLINNHVVFIGCNVMFPWNQTDVTSENVKTPLWKNPVFLTRFCDTIQCTVIPCKNSHQTRF